VADLIQHRFAAALALTLGEKAGEVITTMGYTLGKDLKVIIGRFSDTFGDHLHTFGEKEK